MRKILCFFFFTLLSILVFLGCTHTKKQGNDTIEFKSGTFPYKDWSETVGTYGKAVIPNKEIAIEVATTIFNGMDKRKEMQEYVPTFVFLTSKMKFG